MAIHHAGCSLGDHDLKQGCHDKAMNALGMPEPGHTPGCPGGHNPARECPTGRAGTPGHHEQCSSIPHPLVGGFVSGYCHDADGHRLPPAAERIRTTRLDVAIPAGPQPTGPGPLHAMVCGPGGLDISVSGEPGVFGRLLEAIGDAISASLGD